MKTIQFLLLLLNCLFCLLASTPVDKNLNETQVIQDQSNKETYIPVPLNNDKVSKLSSNNHKSSDDKKQSDNNNNDKSVNDNNINNNGLRQAAAKKSLDKIKPNVKIHKNTSPPKKQQQKEQLRLGNPSNYKTRDQQPHLVGYQSLRDAPTKGDISKFLRSQFEHIQPSHDDLIDYYSSSNNNYHNYNRYNNNDDGDRYSDYEQLDGDAEYEADLNLKHRIKSLAHLLSSSDGLVKPEDHGSLLDEYLGTKVLPRPYPERAARVARAYYDVRSADYDEQGGDHDEDDDVMDSYDLANVMLKRSDSSYLDSYVDNAIRTGLLNPELAKNYKLNVLREYHDMLSNRDDDDVAHNDEDDDDDGGDGEEEAEEGDDDDDLPEILEHGQKDLARSRFPSKDDKLEADFERMTSQPLSRKVEKKFKLTKGHPFNDRQQELEKFASILKQVHLENDLENIARKHANQLVN